MSAPDPDPRPSSAGPSRPAPRAGETPAEGGGGERPGDVIGRYKLLQEIGEGGFGVVWMAEQSEPVRRKIALKIIKLGMDTRQVVARFEAERQALALMDHPNIARVLDGGATDSGRPYFVMELVKGVPIVEYCDKNSLTIDQRLELMAQVCHAVQHAHNKGIIHRDIKPSNVLVGTQDGRPQVKVIDFGIAKATSQTLTERTLFTEHRQVIGTLQYMSPEQALGELDIDTRTDVYSLGILLYELLTGSTPFDVGTLRNALFGEVQRMIREEDPPRPSTRLSESADTLERIAARRRVEPRRLGLLLRGELDWIVMKALEKDRSRRYETANGLAMDLRRYLEGEAVVAAPPSTAYQLRKLVRRHRALMTAVAAVALALLLGLVAFAWQASVAGAQRDRAVDAEGEALASARAAQQARAAAEDSARLADEQRARALAAEAEALARAGELELVADFQAGMLAQVDLTTAGPYLVEDVSARYEAALASAGVPEAERRAQVEDFQRQWARVNAADAARELIDRTILRPAIATIDARFGDQPLVDAQLRLALAKSYVGLGLFDAALPLQADAVETLTRVRGEEQRNTLLAIHDLGHVLRFQGRYAEAEPHLLQALEGCRRLLGEEDPLTLTSISSMGELLQAQGRSAEAEPHLLRALEGRRSVLGPDHEATLSSIGAMGILRQGQGRTAEAEAYYREALETSRRVLGEDSRITLAHLGQLAGVLLVQGHQAEAEQAWKEALETSRRLLGEQHPSTLNLLLNLGGLIASQQRLAEAEPYLGAGLEKARLVLGDEHPETLRAMHNLAALLQDLGRAAEGERLAREAWEGRKRVLGADHPQTLKSLSNVGSGLYVQDKLAEAEPFYREVLAARRRTLGDEHPETLRSIRKTGDLLRVLGKLDEAEPLCLEALETSRRVLGEEHPDTLRSLGALGMLRRSQGEPMQAVALFEEALDKVRRVPGDEHPDAQILLSNLCSALWEQGELAAAESRYRELVASKRRAQGDEDASTLRSITSLAAILREQGELAGAQELLAASEPAARRVLAVDDPTPLAGLLIERGRVRAALGAFAAAEASLLEAHALCSEPPGTSNEETVACVQALVELYAAWDASEPGQGHDAARAEWSRRL